MGALRNIGGVACGVVAAGALIALVESAGHGITDGEAVFAVAALGYGLGAIVGTAIAMVIASRRAAIAVPLALAVLAVVNLFSFPHPVWFTPAAAASLALGWWIGASLCQAWRGGGSGRSAGR